MLSCKKKKKTQRQRQQSRWGSPYLRVSWWGRSLCPEGPPPRWRCSSCRASRGQSGPPRRWRWASPPGGWARPSGRSPPPPAWLTCPPRSPPTWSSPWSPAPRTCCRAVLDVCVFGFVLGKEGQGCRLRLRFPPWRHTPEVVSSFTKLLIFFLPLCRPQRFLSLSLSCAAGWYEKKEKGGQITVP